MSPKLMLDVIKMSVKRKSPELLIAGTIVGFAGTVVLASMETLKLKPIIDDHKDRLAELERIKELQNAPEEVIDDDGEPVEVVDSKVESEVLDVNVGKEKAIVYIKTTGKILKTYAPAIILGALSIACLLESRAIMRRRYLALAGAFTSLNEAFNAYRKRVIDAEGEDKDREYLYGIKKEVIDVVDGDGTVHKEEVEVVEDDSYDFSILFTQGNPNWDEDDVFLKNFLDGIESMASTKLEARGYLLWAEVKEDLGYTPEAKDFFIGWTYNRKDKNLPIPHVDLNRHTVWIKDGSGFAHKGVILEPNHQGVIIDFIDQNSKKARAMKPYEAA